jgi:hypothetical protein
VDFDVQVHVSDGERTGRPDLVLRLPAGGCVPVDSKANVGRLPGQPERGGPTHPRGSP